jgi:hypothetical protein
MACPGGRRWVLPCRHQLLLATSAEALQLLTLIELASLLGTDSSSLAHLMLNHYHQFENFSAELFESFCWLNNADTLPKTNTAAGIPQHTSKPDRVAVLQVPYLDIIT